MVVKRKRRDIYTILLLVVLALALFIRLYNFSNRITFGPEQAISLITSGEYLKTKFSLLGQANLIRFTSTGHVLYASPLFNYSLVPLITLFKYDVIKITGYFVFLNVFTGVALYWVVKKMFHQKVALLATVLFLFNDYMVYHSMFIWILNYLPLLFVGVIYLFFLYKQKKKLLYPFLLGVLSGVGVGLEYFYGLTLLGTLFLIIYLSKNKIRDTLIFILGAFLGNFPYIIFDLRHSFYQTNVLLQYGKDLLSLPSQARISYYHFLNFWPLIFLIVAYYLEKLLSKKRLIVGILLICYLVIMLFSKRVDFLKPTGMVLGMNYQKVLKVSEIIANDKPQGFNLATLLDFDTRGYVLRYPVEYIYGYEPMGVEEYPKTKTLYVLSENNYDYINPKVWELQVMMPYEVTHMAKIDDSYGLYKVTKEE